MILFEKNDKTGNERRDIHETGLQMSSSLPVMILLNLSGGTQDACSYFLRDHVFANAQTGNIVLMGCYLISEDLRNSIRYYLDVFYNN